MTDPRIAYCLERADETLLHWMENVGRRDIEAVLPLYAQDALLVPTLSDEVRGDDDRRRNYFESFLDNDGMSCTLTDRKARVNQRLGTVAIGGLYTFVITKNGNENTVAARFLFTFEEIGDRWLITGHHSSKSAETAVA